MTKQEAYKAMQAGNKVTHRYFSDDEYLYMDERSYIFTEEGYSFEAGWEMRYEPDWQIDWSIIKSPHTD